MVFKKKESNEQKAARLEKELAETVAKVERELPPIPEPPTPVQEMKNDKNGDVEAYKTFIENTMERYDQSFPELGPSGHAHVERTLLVAILAELKELREALKK